MSLALGSMAVRVVEGVGNNVDLSSQLEYCVFGPSNRCL